MTTDPDGGTGIVERALRILEEECAAWVARLRPAPPPRPPAGANDPGQAGPERSGPRGGG